MKISRFIFSISFITFFSLLYVYQQTEIFRLAYVGEKQASLFQELLDKNTVLRYNIESSASLINIGNKIMQNNDYEMPQTYQMVNLPAGSTRMASGFSKKENFLVKFFSLKQEAEAKTINP